MGAPRTDIVDLPHDYVPKNGERFFVVFKPSVFHRALTGRGLNNFEAVEALNRIKEKVLTKYGDSYKIIGLKTVEASDGTIDEMHVEVLAIGTPPLLIWIGISIVATAFAVVSDRVYKVVDKTPEVVSFAGIGILAFALVLLPVLRKSLGKLA